jgi:hypothetical protein
VLPKCHSINATGFSPTHTHFPCQTDGEQNGYTALHLAACQNHEDIVAKLIASGASINARHKVRVAARRVSHVWTS